MHLLLTDRLSCPRCGPPFGLVLLAHRLEDRVVHEGLLGCANCRDSFPIVGGLGDLRAPPRGEMIAGLAGGPAPADAARSAGFVARLGILGGPGTVALVGEPARYAEGVARALPDIHVAAIDSDLIRWPESERVSRLVSSPGIPFFDATLRAVAIDARLGPSWIIEAARAVASRGRVVVAHPTEDTAEALERASLRILSSDQESVVAARS